MPIKILIADDHGVVAEGLKHLVEAQPDMQVVACVEDGRAAVQQARDAQPDVVLMDLSMPELNGADATRAIISRDPKCRVIVLSMYAQREYVRRALKAGAAVRDARNDLDVALGFDQVAQAFGHHFMVVGDQDADRHG